MRPRPYSHHRSRAAGIAALLVLGTGLTALFLRFDWFWIVFVVGFAAFVPLVNYLFDDGDDGDDGGKRGRPEQSDTADVSTDGSNERDPLETLRQRYAAGELTDDQFERKVEALLETETLEAAEDRAHHRESKTESAR